MLKRFLIPSSHKKTFITALNILARNVKFLMKRNNNITSNTFSLTYLVHKIKKIFTLLYLCNSNIRALGQHYIGIKELSNLKIKYALNFLLMYTLI